MIHATFVKTQWRHVLSAFFFFCFVLCIDRAFLLFSVRHKSCHLFSLIFVQNAITVDAVIVKWTDFLIIRSISKELNKSSCDACYNIYYNKYFSVDSFSTRQLYNRINIQNAYMSVRTPRECPTSSLSRYINV